MLSILQMDDELQWNPIVRSFKNYDVYYLLEYLKTFWLHGDGFPLLFYYEDSKIRAINAVMKRDIEKDRNFVGKIPPETYYDITTPYGYGGFLIEEDLIEGDLNEESLTRLNTEYTDYCRYNGIICEFVRFHPVIQNEKAVAKLYDVTELGKTITMNLQTKEQLWSDFTSQNRNKIQKAKKNGIQIFRGLNPELMLKFMTLYNKTMDKVDASDYYYFNFNFFTSYLETLQKNTLIFYAMLEDKMIAASLILFENEQMHYHLSASDREYQQLAPTNLLLYETACWGVDHGYKTLHLGGGVGSREDSLLIFKKSFNRNSDTSFSIGKKVFDRESYNKFVELRKSEPDFNLNNSYFPLYRS